ncbi:MAG: hypothetical protein M3245_02725, partial [Actinomycetota bacterium]|nr:hypothetical protein [Actinomycetota bacterium]
MNATARKLLSVVVLLGAACQGESPLPGGSPDGPEEQVVSTGDLSSIVLQPDEAPGGLVLNEHASGPRTVLQATSGAQDRVTRLTEAGYQLGWQQRFEVEGFAGAEQPEPVDIGVVVLGSSANAYASADGARTVFDQPTPPPFATDYVTELLEGLGDAARVATYRQETRFGNVPTISIEWLRPAATLSITAIGTEASTPDRDALIELARLVDGRVSPGGAPPIEIPQPEPGQVLLEDDFSDPASGWDPQDYGPEAQSDYRDGRFVLSVTSGSLWNGTEELGEELHQLTDTRVEATGAPTEENEEARYGFICRRASETEVYYALVGTNGSGTVAKFVATQPQPIALFSAPAGTIDPPAATDRLRSTASAPARFASHCGRASGSSPTPSTTIPTSRERSAW